MNANDPVVTRKDSIPDGKYHRPSLLVVEDNADLRELWEMEFERWGLSARLIFVSDGFRALMVMSRDPPALVITDLRMPGPIDGRELVDIMGRNPPYDRIPVIVMSGDVADDLLDRPSVVACFRKPASLVDLRRFIESRFSFFVGPMPDLLR